jgi:hypothetical protein
LFSGPRWLLGHSRQFDGALSISGLSLKAGIQISRDKAGVVASTKAPPARISLILDDGAGTSQTQKMQNGTGLIHQAIQVVAFVFSSPQNFASVFQKFCLSLSHPAPTRGALRDRHECWARDAMDACGACDERG